MKNRRLLSIFEELTCTTLLKNAPLLLKNLPSPAK